MKINLTHLRSDIFFPDDHISTANLHQTTHLGIGAHQDDLEIFAIHGILAAYDDPEKFFTGVTVTDGRGAPRTGPFADITDQQMWEIRTQEQKKAAHLGHYLAQFLLNYPSDSIKSDLRYQVVNDLKNIIKTCQPQVIYTHNLADKHPTHVATSLAVIEALQSLGRVTEAIKCYGCEVWRDLDWLPENKKVSLDVSSHPDLQKALLGVYKSQISGGKRYDLAALGRRQANATFFQSHQTDKANAIIYAMDLTPLIQTPEADIQNFVDQCIDAFIKDVRTLLEGLGER